MERSIKLRAGIVRGLLGADCDTRLCWGGRCWPWLLLVGVSDRYEAVEGGGVIGRNGLPLVARVRTLWSHCRGTPLPAPLVELIGVGTVVIVDMSTQSLLVWCGMVSPYIT